MHVSETKLKKVLMVELDAFRDFRGEYVETYNEELYRQHVIEVPFIQDDISVSYQNVLRGIHGDNETWKLISCIFGEFYFVVVNCDAESEDFGKWQSFILSDKERVQILVPPRYGNAHLVLSQKAVFQYKQSTYYRPESQFTYKWNDPRFNISWPIKNPILSERDKSVSQEAL